MTHLMRVCGLVIAGYAAFWTAGCQHDKPASYELVGDASDTRILIRLPAETDRQHREVMMQHLETVQVLTSALAAEDFELARGVTEAHMGFFARRHVAIRHKMESIPAEYRALASAHVQAVKELAVSMPSKDMKQIMPRFNAMLKTCMACHLEFRSDGTSLR